MTKENEKTKNVDYELIGDTLDEKAELILVYVKNIRNTIQNIIVEGIHLHYLEAIDRNVYNIDHNAHHVKCIAKSIIEKQESD